MSKPRTAGSLQVNQDLMHERREWLAERVAWGLFALMLAAALAGVFGNGPLSHARAGAAGSTIWAEYERLERARNESALDVYLGPGALVDGRVQLSVNREFVDRMNVLRLQPEPDSQILSDGAVLYEYEARTSGAPLHVAIMYEAAGMGFVPVRIGVDAGPSLEFRQFVFP